MIVVAIVLCLDVAYLMAGSLEEFPTGEQESKVRVVTSVVAAVLLVVEAALWFIYRQLRRNGDVSGSAG